MSTIIFDRYFNINFIDFAVYTTLYNSSEPGSEM